MVLWDTYKLTFSSLYRIQIRLWFIKHDNAAYITYW